MAWQVLTFLSVFLFSGAVVAQRRLLHRHQCDPHTFAVLSQTVVGVFALLFALVKGFAVPNFSGLWLPAIGSITLHGFGYIAHAKALQRMEASVFSVFYATQAVWIMLLGILLFHEHPTSMELLGVLCIFGSIALLLSDRRKQAFAGAAGLGLLTGLLFGLAVVCWVYVGRQVDTLSWAAIGFWGVAFTAFLARPRALYNVRSFLVKPVALHMLLIGLLLSAASIALLFAYAGGSVSAVSPLRQMSIVVTVMLALIILPQERTNIWRKLAAVGLCFLGALLIV